LHVVSASTRSTGLTATMGSAGWRCRTIARNAASPDRKSAASCGVRDQQLVPCDRVITSAGNPAISSADAISPRAAPA
jgi:hypothetical protein